MITFNVTYDSTITSQSSAFQSMYTAAVNAALGFLGHLFTNNVTINITFSWAALGGSAAAGNNFYYNTYSYSQIKTALINSQKSPDDIAAYTTFPVSDPTGAGHVYALTSGQAKALGLGFSPPYDDLVTLNSSLNWTFDPNNRAVAGKYDAIGALEHEITEGVFGRIASLGQSDALGAGKYTPLDLFRYSSGGVRDFNPDNSDYFSITGTTLLTQFNNWATGDGDPADLGDWFPTIQGDSFGDAYTGTASLVTATDIRELDVLGWNRAAPFDLNGDNYDDIPWWNSSSGAVSYYQMNPSGGYTWHNIGGVAAGYTPLIGDFNGDSKSDILWWNSSTGSVSYYDINPSGGYTWHNIGGVSAGYQPFVGDFNGDGTSDILWWNSSTDAVSYYAINPAGGYTWHNIGSVSAGYQPLVGDFNGDGTSDILWWNSSTGAVSYYAINPAGGYTWHNIGGVALGYQPFIGDFNGDGKSDIMWWNSSNGSVSYYDVNPAGGYTWHNIGGVASGYTPFIRDFNGDGVSDIGWYNSSTGAVSEYQINPAGGYTWHNIGSVASGYSVVS